MRKKLTKKLTAVIVSCACFALAVVASYAPPSSVTAERARISAVNDEFNAAALDSAVWTSSDEAKAGVRDYGGAIVLRDSDYAHAINWMGYERRADGSDGVFESYSLEFILTRESSSGAWTSCYLGLENPDLRANTITNTDGTRGYMFVMNDGNAILYTKNNSVSTGAVPMGMKADGTRYAIRLDATVREGESDVLTVYCVKAPDDTDAVDYGEPKGTITGNDAVGDLDLTGYFGFGCLMTKTEKTTISKIRLTEGEKVWTPQNDLKTLDIDHIYGSQPSDTTKEFRCWNSYKDAVSDKYTNGPVGKLRVKEGGSVYSVEELETDASLISLLSMNFKMRITEAGEGCDVVFGKTGDAESVVRFTVADGKIRSAIGDSFLDTGVDASGEHTVTLDVKSGGKVLLSIDGTSKGTISGADSFSGKIGFEANAGADFEVDDLSVVYYRNRSSSEADMSIDFSIKNSRGNTYIDSAEWYTSGNALLTKYDEISFVNANPDSVFSSRKAYSDYVFKFDLFDVGQGDGGCNWIGISFAKSAYEGDWTTAPTIMFAPRGSGDGIFTNLETQSGARFNTGENMRCTHNIFTEMGTDSTHKKLNVVLEVCNRSVKLYFKYDDQPESELAVPKAVIEDVDTYGFVGINCNYGGNFAIGNVSLRNLNPDRSFIASYGDKVGEQDRLTGDSSVRL